jgi:hypothetical protein
MRAIIIAAGEGLRWGDYLGIPKHLAEVDGEPVLYRTARLLKQNGVSEIIIVGPTDPRYKLDKVNLFVPEKHPEYADADKFLSSEILWNTKGRTITLFGDVFFSEEAMTTIVSCDRKIWTVFGRSTGSEFTGTQYGEIFAHSFFPEDIPKHKECLEILVGAVNSKDAKNGSGWEHYKVMQGVRGRDIRRSKIITDNNFVEINDFTEDFDYPDDYDEFIKRWEAAKTK